MSAKSNINHSKKSLPGENVSSKRRPSYDTGTVNADPGGVLYMNENQALELRDSAKRQLEQIRTVETGIEYLNKVKAIEVGAKAEKKDAELQNLIAEQKLRTQRILGQLIKDGQKAGEIATQSNNPGGNYKFGIPEGNTKTLTEIGITAKESSTFQQIASIPDELFENEIHEKKLAVEKAVSELTTAGMVKLAKEINFTNKLENSGETKRDLDLIERLKNGETVVLNMKTDLFAMNWAIKNNKFVRVDRGSEYGNPFLLPDDGNRESVCLNYATHYIVYKPSILRKIKLLKGMALGCWCAPLMCHADELKKLANE